LRERIGQPRESPHLHPHREILPLNVACRNVLGVWTARNFHLSATDALWRTIAGIVFGTRAVELHEHGVIYLIVECFFDRREVGTMAVRRELHAIGKTLRQIIHESID